VFASNRGGDWDIYSQPADGSRAAEVLLKRPSDQFPYSFAPDGTLLFTEIGPRTGRDLWTLSPDGKPSPVRVTGSNEYAAQFSQDGGRLIAYTSDESGRPEIYVQSYPGGEHRIPVSTAGGVRPMWSPDGRDLFFVTGDAFVAVAVQSNGTFGPPRRLTDRSQFLINDRFQSFSIAPDGKRILMIHRDEGAAPRQLNVILNWLEVPRGRQ
jgi:Tol biopolymer transport system component